MRKAFFVALLGLVFTTSAFAYDNSVTYVITNTPGSFFVKMEGEIPVGIHNLVIFSSSDQTTYTDLAAREMPDDWEMDVQTIYEGMPKIHAFVDTPVIKGEERFYDIDAQFIDDTTLYDDGDGLVFSRKTNFAKVTVILPEGYHVIDQSDNLLGVSEVGRTILTAENPKHKMMQIFVKFFELDSLLPAYPESIDTKTVLPVKK
jgi:hypothetical protein